MSQDNGKTVHSIKFFSVEELAQFAGEMGFGPYAKEKPSTTTSPVRWNDHYVNVSDKEFADDEERTAFDRRLDRSLQRLSTPKNLGYKCVEHLTPQGAEEVTKQISELEAQFPNSPLLKKMKMADEHRAKSLVAFADGDMETAITSWAATIRTFPGIWLTFFSDDRLRTCEEYYSDASNPNNLRAEALFVFAYLREVEWNRTRCEESFSPDMLQAFEKLNFTRALKTIKLAQVLVPREPSYHLQEGKLQMQLNNYADAIPPLQLALLLGSNDQNTIYMYLAAAYRWVGKHDDAIRFLKEYIKLTEPDDVHVSFACYHLSLLLGRKGPSFLGEAKRYFYKGDEATAAMVPTWGNLMGQKKCGEFLREGAWKLVKMYNPCGNPQCSVAAFSHCSRCETVFYCSPSCQKLHWPTHKPECKKACAMNGKKKTSTISKKTGATNSKTGTTIGKETSTTIGKKKASTNGKKKASTKKKKGKN